MSTDNDTGIGSPPAARPTTQAIAPLVIPTDPGVGSTVAARFDVFDELSRQVMIVPTGVSFTTSPGGPS